MENKEAIERLKSIKSLVEKYEDVLALRMAISALSAQEKICPFNSDNEVTEYCVEGPCEHLKECPYEEIKKLSTIPTDGDLISRKAVLEWLDKHDYCGWLEDTPIKDLKTEIEELPTIPQPKTDGELISRKAVLDCKHQLTMFGYSKMIIDVADVEKLPTIPQVVCDNDCEHCSWVECPLTEKAEQSYSWCDGCKEYDKDKHYCPRFSRVIKDTLNDKVDSVLEDIKAEINQERNFNKPNFNIENLSGLVRALEIIDKHISRKEKE